MTAVGDELLRAVGEGHARPLGDGAWQVDPGSPPEVAEVIAIARRAAMPVRPVGTGTKPIRLSGPRLEVSTRRLDHVIHLDETSLLVHVQAGITGLALEKVLAPRGLSIGDYSPSILGSSLGGLVAVRTPGKSSARHGFFEDAVVGLSAVLADGRTLHTRVAPRRSTGPDLGRALCGSEGTIGFITSVVLRIHRRPESRLVAAYTLPTVDAAVRAVYLALHEEAAPSGLRIACAGEAEAHFPASLFGGPVPLPTGTQALLLAATAGPTDLAACDRDLVTSAVTAEGGGLADPRLAEVWWRRLHHGEPTPGPSPTLQVTATPASLRPVHAGVRAAVLAAGGTVRAHISRFDADGAVVFFTLSGPRPEGLRDAAEAAARAAGGWLLGARATRLDPYLASFQAALDPTGIMNPGALGA